MQLRADVKAAFQQTTYVENGQLKDFETTLCKASDMFVNGEEYDGGLLMAPYLAMVQSSGYGKSRLVYEYAKKSFSFYICTRNEGIHNNDSFSIFLW